MTESPEQPQSIDPVPRLVGWLRVMLFIGAISAPIGFQLAGVRLTRMKENRRLAPFPKVEANADAILGFPDRFRRYFDDHMGLRDTLIQWNTKWHVQGLGVVPRRKIKVDVLLGRDGWLYVGGDAGAWQHRALDPFKPDELKRWADHWQGVHNRLDRKGTRFLLVIVPDKHAVYPENLPSYMTQVNPQTRMEQLSTYLSQHTNVELLDLRPVLNAAKSTGRVYQKTDSHWNDYGAFIAYQAIVNRARGLGVQVGQAFELRDFDIRQKHRPGGDVAGMLGMSKEFSETVQTMKLTAEQFAIDASGQHESPLTRGFYPDGFVAVRPDAPALPKAVIVRDSYSEYYLPWLSEHFSRAVYQYSYSEKMPFGMIEREGPDIVIKQTTERYLIDRIPESKP